MEQLVISDFSEGTVDIYNVDPHADINEDYIEKLGYDINTCSWMFTGNLKVEFHKEILK